MKQPTSPAGTSPLPPLKPQKLGLKSWSKSPLRSKGPPVPRISNFMAGRGRTRLEALEETLGALDMLDFRTDRLLEPTAHDVQPQSSLLSAPPADIRRAQHSFYSEMLDNSTIAPSASATSPSSPQKCGDDTIVASHIKESSWIDGSYLSPAKIHLNLGDPAHANDSARYNYISAQSPRWEACNSNNHNHNNYSDSRIMSGNWDHSSSRMTHTPPTIITSIRPAAHPQGAEKRVEGYLPDQQQHQSRPWGSQNNHQGSGPAASAAASAASAAAAVHVDIGAESSMQPPSGFGRKLDLATGSRELEPGLPSTMSQGPMFPPGRVDQRDSQDRNASHAAPGSRMRGGMGQGDDGNDEMGERRGHLVHAGSRHQEDMPKAVANGGPCIDAGAGPLLGQDGVPEGDGSRHAASEEVLAMLDRMIGICFSNTEAFQSLWSHQEERVAFDQVWSRLEEEAKAQLRPELKIVFSTRCSRLFEANKTTLHQIFLSHGTGQPPSLSTQDVALRLPKHLAASISGVDDSPHWTFDQLWTIVHPGIRNEVKTEVRGMVKAELNELLSRWRTSFLAVFDSCESGGDGRVCKKHLTQSLVASPSLALLLQFPTGFGKQER